MGMDTMTWNILNWTATTWPLTNCKHRTRISKEFSHFFLLKNTTTYCVVIIIIDDDALTNTTTPTFATQSVAIECPIKWLYSINGNRPKDKLDFGKSTSTIWNLCWIEVYCRKKKLFNLFDEPDESGILKLENIIQMNNVLSSERRKRETARKKIMIEWKAWLPFKTFIRPCDGEIFQFNSILNEHWTVTFGSQNPTF